MDKMNEFVQEGLYPPYRSVAGQLESLFKISSARVERIKQIDDLVFRVLDSEGNPFKYKIFRESGANKKLALIAIAQWLNDLADRLDYAFPYFLPNRNGEWVSSVSTESGQRWASLQKWIDWPVLPRFTENDLYRLGRLMAMIHSTTASYSGEDRAMKRIDGAWLRGPALSALTGFSDQLGWSAEDRRRLTRTLTSLSDFLDRQGYDRGAFGLIHSDWHRNNILAQGESLALIDFEDALIGHYALDIGILLNELADYPDAYQSFRDSFLRGYQDIRLLELGPAQQKAFRAVGDAIYAEWVWQLSQASRSGRPESWDYGCEALRSLVAF